MSDKGNSTQALIRRDVESTLRKMLRGLPVSEDQKLAVNLGIKYMAVCVKLDMDQWGSELEKLAAEDDNEPENDI